MLQCTYWQDHDLIYDGGHVMLFSYEGILYVRPVCQFFLCFDVIPTWPSLFQRRNTSSLSFYGFLSQFCVFFLNMCVFCLLTSCMTLIDDLAQCHELFDTLSV